MTEDELDLLASAYLDGEATSEEVAVVERDPELQARVENLRAISAQLGPVPEPPPVLKEQHLAAALAAFDIAAGESNTELAAASEPGPTDAKSSREADRQAENVLDFKARAQAQETADRMNRVRPVGVGGLPSWMPAAAVFILISGGIIALISTSGSDNDSAFDTAAGSTETEAADSSEDSADEGSDDAAESETMLAEADAVMEDEEAMEDDESMEDDAMEEEVATDSDDGDADETSAAPAPSSTTTARSGGGLFPQEPVLVFDDLPEDLLAELTSVDELRAIGESMCGAELSLADGVTAFGYIPVELAGLPAELFALVDGDGQELAILVDAAACIPIE